jgi:hypothetical protein
VDGVPPTEARGISSPYLIRSPIHYEPTALREVQPSDEQPGKQRFQGVPRSHDGERRESSDEHAAGDIGHVVLTSVDAGQPDEPRKDQGGDAGALRNQEQRYGNREGERRMVAGKRRVMRG